MSGYKGFRKKKWNKSGCDPFNNGIPAKLYGCSEEWRYELCELQQPNPQNYRIVEFGTININIESQRCPVDGYNLSLWEELVPGVKEFKFHGGNFSLTGLDPDKVYKFSVIGFREIDNMLSKPSIPVSFYMPKTGSYNKMIDGICVENTNGVIDCTNYLEF